MNQLESLVYALLGVISLLVTIVTLALTCKTGTYRTRKIRCRSIRQPYDYIDQSINENHSLNVTIIIYILFLLIIGVPPVNLAFAFVHVSPTNIFKKIHIILGVG